jgi:hypothetical protein
MGGSSEGFGQRCISMFGMWRSDISTIQTKVMSFTWRIVYDVGVYLSCSLIRISSARGFGNLLRVIALGI